MKILIGFTSTKRSKKHLFYKQFFHKNPFLQTFLFHSVLWVIQMDKISLLAINLELLFEEKRERRLFIFKFSLFESKNKQQSFLPISFTKPFE